MNSKKHPPNKKLVISSMQIEITNPNTKLISPKKTLEEISQLPNKRPNTELKFPNSNISSSAIQNNLQKKYIKYPNIKYGIDESGNPMNIKEYYKSVNESIYSNTNLSAFSEKISLNKKLKKPIAYIAKDEKGNNILLDLKGNIINKRNKEGDYYFPLELHITVKDFDVKHPELRVNGESYYNENLDIIRKNKNEEKNKNNNEQKDYLSQKINKMKKVHINSQMDKIIDRNKINVNSHNKNNCNYQTFFRPHEAYKSKYSLNLKNNNTINNEYFNIFEKFKTMTKNQSFITPRIKSIIFDRLKKSKSNKDSSYNIQKNKQNNLICKKIHDTFYLKHPKKIIKIQQNDYNKNLIANFSMNNFFGLKINNKVRNNNTMRITPKQIKDNKNKYKLYN